jgi:thiol-disulfide isomerase/thioredoxin
MSNRFFIFENKMIIKFTTVKIFWLLGSTLISITSQAQHTLTGTFPALAGQKVKLVGFEGMGIYPIDSTKVSEKGEFKLKYTSKDNGMGYLSAADNKASFVVLDNEDIQLKGDLLSIPESIVCLSGKENQLFAKYAMEHPKLEQALSAWDYLQKLYQSDSLYLNQKETKNSIEKEILRIQNEDANFLNGLDAKSYISWFLPIRKLVSSVSNIAQNKPEEIASALSAFRQIDYADKKLYKSGLLKNIIESHYWLLENMGKPLDTVNKEMNISTNYLINSLAKDEKKLNEITNYLFDLLERHSLFEASEYLALKALTQNSCTLNSDLAKQLEIYRTMKKGNTAPDIVFTGDVYNNGTIIKKSSKLSEIKSPYTIVIFGASWCPKCVEEMSRLLPLYEKWKSKGLEVVFVSMDTDKISFDKFVKDFPFTSTCDYKKWDSKAAQDYYVFASPTLFLLDANRKIALRPNSVKQIDAWVDSYLK